VAIGEAFQIGRSALAAYQAAISITGQNIANLGNADYARQSGRLSAQVGGSTVSGVRPGAGVNLTHLTRHVDRALEARLQRSLATRASAEAIYNALNQTEILYNELTEVDLSTQLSEFFAQFSNLETSPQDSSCTPGSPARSAT
jgi:flagellar hook-associated protein 1 FlgK